jgi:hypothetical protein
MTDRTGLFGNASDAMIWIDHEQAIIATRQRDGAPFVERLGRGPLEPETAFEARAVDELLEASTVTVSGPAYARTSFERALVAVTHRPDGIVDVEPWIDSPDVADLPFRRRAR